MEKELDFLSYFRNTQAILYAREEDKADKKEDEFLVSDLVGLDVFSTVENTNTTALYVGKVGGVVFGEDISSVPGLHDMLEVILSKGNTSLPSLSDELVLIPFVPEIVPMVDLAGGAIYIDPPTGLLDLSFVRKEKIRIKGLLQPCKKDS